MLVFGRATRLVARDFGGLERRGGGGRERLLLSAFGFLQRLLMLGNQAREALVLVIQRGLVLDAQLGQLRDPRVEIDLGLFGFALEVVGAFDGLVLVALGRLRGLGLVADLLLELYDAIGLISLLTFEGDRVVAQPK